VTARKTVTVSLESDVTGCLHGGARLMLKYSI